MNRSYLKLFAIVLFGVFTTASTLFAQSVNWTPASGTLQQGKANNLQLHFEGCSPDGNVDLPNVPGVSFTQVGQSSSMNIFNSRVVQKLILEFRVSPTSEGTVTIPSFSVRTDKGNISVEAASFEVIEATLGNTGMKPDDIFKSELSVTDDSIHEGEIFTLRYVLGVRQDYQNRLNDISLPQWNPVGVVTKGFESHRSTNFKYRNFDYSAVLFETPAMATRNGEIKLPKVNQNVSMVVGRRRGFIFDDPVVDNYNIESETLQLSIKPLPTGEPTSFTGAVGQFQFESKVIPEIVQVGEPVTWTLKLSGTGNWPQGFGLKPRNVSASFRSIQPDVNKEVSEDSPFEGSLSEDIVLIPTKEGDFEFGPIEFSFFNPKTDRYESINIPAKTVVVNPLIPQNDPNNLSTPSIKPTTSKPQPSDSLPFELDPSGVNLLTKPVELLSSPLGQSAQGSIPKGGVKLGYLAFSFAAPSLFWALIALIRSLSLDPNKQRRRAFKQLKQTTMALDDAEPAKREAQLAWRAAAREFWEIEIEEPSSTDIEKAVSEKSGIEQANRWKTLWQNSDKMLFGKRAPSFKEWQSELRDLLNQLRQPGISVRRLFSSGAWFASIAAIAVLVPTLDGLSNEGLDHYNEAAFSKASSSWLSELNSNPHDWTLRHNLGLAAAQEERWGEAIAYWTSAFLLETDSPELRWNLKVGLSKSGGYYPTLARLVKGDGLMAYISILTPAEWEKAAYLSMVVAALAFTGWVTFAYFPQRKRIRFTFAAIGLFAVALVFGSNWARAEYGLLANPEAMVVITEGQLKSVPTDLEVEQIQSPLPEGSVCLVTKTFLGWMKVELPNGEQGWSRKENLTPLYGSLGDIL